MANVREALGCSTKELPAVITGLKQYAEAKKPKARPATKPTEPGTLEQNPENP